MTMQVVAMQVSIQYRGYFLFLKHLIEEEMDITKKTKR